MDIRLHMFKSSQTGSNNGAEETFVHMLSQESEWKINIIGRYSNTLPRSYDILTQIDKINNCAAIFASTAVSINITHFNC